MSNSVSLHLRRLERAFKPVTMVVCAYETVALVSDGKAVPMLSVVANKHKWLIPVITGVLAAHFWYLEVTDDIPES